MIALRELYGVDRAFIAHRETFFESIFFWDSCLDNVSEIRKQNISVFYKDRL